MLSATRAASFAVSRRPRGGAAQQHREQSRRKEHQLQQQQQPSQLLGAPANLPGGTAHAMSMSSAKVCRRLLMERLPLSPLSSHLSQRVSNFRHPTSSSQMASSATGAVTKRPRGASLSFPSSSSKGAVFTKPSTPSSSHRPARYLYAPYRNIDVDRLFSNTGVSAENKEPITEAYVDVRVPSCHLTPANACVKRRVIWGTDWYTDDSDVVCMLMHSGNVALPLPNTEDGARSPVVLVVRLQLVRHSSSDSFSFTETERHAIRSRSWYGRYYTGARVRIAHVASVRSGVEMELAKPVLACVPVYARALTRNRLVPAAEVNGSNGNGNGNGEKKDSQAPESLVAATAMENVKRKRYWSEVHVAFDMLNEPCMKYGLHLVDAIGKDERISKRRRMMFEAMYVEGGRHRFEIARLPSGDTKYSQENEDVGEVLVRFAKVKRESVMNMILARGKQREQLRKVPMDESTVHVLHEDIPWKELKWDHAGVAVKGVHYKLDKISFRTLDALPVEGKEDGEEEEDDIAVKDGKQDGDVEEQEVKKPAEDVKEEVKQSAEDAKSAAAKEKQVENAAKDKEEGKDVEEPCAAPMEE